MDCGGPDFLLAGKPYFLGNIKINNKQNNTAAHGTSWVINVCNGDCTRTCRVVADCWSWWLSPRDSRGNHRDEDVCSLQNSWLMHSQRHSYSGSVLIIAIAFVIKTIVFMQKIAKVEYINWACYGGIVELICVNFLFIIKSSKMLIRIIFVNIFVNTAHFSYKAICGCLRTSSFSSLPLKPW